MYVSVDRRHIVRSFHPKNVDGKVDCKAIDGLLEEEDANLSSLSCKISNEKSDLESFSSKAVSLVQDEFVVKAGGVLNEIRMLLTLRHYAFRTYLASKVLLHGSELAIVTEEYTSKTCGRCGHIKENLGGAEVYKCQECGFKCGRDANGSRNILLKHLWEPKNL
ncbi:putative IS605 transposase [Chloropicon primus]|nr:putative IS605 transposase [Chloropicon primus]